MNLARRPRVRARVRALLLCSVVLVSSLASSRAASAEPIDLDTWYEFSWFGQGVPATGCDPADPDGDFCIASSGTPTSPAPAPPWIFTAPGIGATLTVVDAFNSGDRFVIFDSGLPIGSTSLPPTIGVDCGADPLVCLASADHSHGVFSLLPGPHALTIVAILSPTQSGVGYFQVTAGSDAVVPEPTTVVLIATGLASVLIARRPRRTR